VDGSAFSTEELFEDLIEIYERFKGKGGNVLVGHSFGSSQVIRLAESLQRREGGQPQHTHDAGAGAGEVRGAMYPPFSSFSSSSSSLLGLVLLASAYHVPDGGNPIFTLPLPVLNLMKPIISQVFKSKAIDSHADPSIWKEHARGNQGRPFSSVPPSVPPSLPLSSICFTLNGLTPSPPSLPPSRQPHVRRQVLLSTTQMGTTREHPLPLLPLCGRPRRDGLDYSPVPRKGTSS